MLPGAVWSLFLWTVVSVGSKSEGVTDPGLKPDSVGSLRLPELLRTPPPRAPGVQTRVQTGVQSRRPLWSTPGPSPSPDPVLQVSRSRRRRSIFPQAGVRICPQESLGEVLTSHKSYYQLRVCQEAVWEAFRIFLDRIPGTSEYQTWVQTCQSEFLCISDIARNFSGSEEHLSLVQRRMNRMRERRPPARGSAGVTHSSKVTEKPRVGSRGESVDQVLDKGPTLSSDRPKAPPTVATALSVVTETDAAPLSPASNVTQTTDQSEAKEDSNLVPEVLQQQTVVFSVVLVDPGYRQLLEERPSPQYHDLDHDLEDHLQEQMKLSLKKLPGFKSLSVTGIRPVLGGILVQYSLQVENQTPDSESLDPDQDLKDLIRTTIQDQSSLPVDLKSLNYAPDLTNATPTTTKPTIEPDSHNEFEVLLEESDSESPLVTAPLTPREKGNALVTLLDPTASVPDLDTPVVPDLDTPVVPDLDTPVVTDLDTPVVPDLDPPVVPDLDTPVVPDLDTPVVPDLDTPVVTDLDTPVVPDLDTPVVPDLDTPVVPDLDTPVVPDLDTPVVPDLDTPVVPDLDTPVVPDLDTPVVPDLDTPVVPDLDTPVVRDLDTPVVTDLDTPVVPDLDTPVVTDLDTPVVRDLDTPVVTDLDTPVVPDLDTPVVTDLDTPVVTDLDTPVVPDLDTPVVPDLDTPVVTDTDTPAVTDTDTPAVPDLDTPVVPDLDTPVVPDLDTPVVTDLDTPAVPDLDTPVVPDMDTPAVPDLDTPAVPDLEAPVVSDLDTPAVPDLDTPAVPDLDTPAIPDLDTPPIPDLDTPAVPDLETPAASNLEAPEVPHMDTPASIPGLETSAVSDLESPALSELLTPAVRDLDTPAVPDLATPAVPDQDNPGEPEGGDTPLNTVTISINVIPENGQHPEFSTSPASVQNFLTLVTLDEEQIIPISATTPEITGQPPTAAVLASDDQENVILDETEEVADLERIGEESEKIFYETLEESDVTPIDSEVELFDETPTRFEELEAGMEMESDKTDSDGGGIGERSSEASAELETMMDNVFVQTDLSEKETAEETLDIKFHEGALEPGFEQIPDILEASEDQTEQEAKGEQSVLRPQAEGPETDLDSSTKQDVRAGEETELSQDETETGKSESAIKKPELEIVVRPKQEVDADEQREETVIQPELERKAENTAEEKTVPEEGTTEARPDPTKEELHEPQEIPTETRPDLTKEEFDKPEEVPVETKPFSTKEESFEPEEVSTATKPDSTKEEFDHVLIIKPEQELEEEGEVLGVRPTSGGEASFQPESPKEPTETVEQGPEVTPGIEGETIIQLSSIPPTEQVTDVEPPLGVEEKPEPPAEAIKILRPLDGRDGLAFGGRDMVVMEDFGLGTDEGNVNIIPMDREGETELEDSEPEEAEPEETRPVEAKRAEPEPAEVVPGEGEPKEAEPVEAEPEMAEPGEKVLKEAEPVDVVPVGMVPEEAEPGEAEPEEKMLEEAAEVIPVEVVSKEAEPEEAEPDEAGPVWVEPAEVEPEEKVPEEAEPEEAGPVWVEPAKVEPEEKVPEEAEPEEAGPVWVEPAEVEPEEKVPEEAEPEEAGPVWVEPAEVEPEEKVLEEAEPAEVTPVEVVSKEAEPGETEPEEKVLEEAEPAEVVLVEVVPEQAEPAEVVPEEADPEEAGPVGAKPAKTEPVEVEPEEVETENAVPEEAKPVEVVQEEAEPVEAAPEEAEPAVVVPKEVEPEEVETENAVPEEAEPMEAEPEEANSEKAQPAEAVPLDAEPAEAVPEEAETAEAEPVEVEPEEVVPVEEEPVEAEPGDDTGAGAAPGLQSFEVHEPQRPLSEDKIPSSPSEKLMPDEGQASIKPMQDPLPDEDLTSTKPTETQNLLLDQDLEDKFQPMGTEDLVGGADLVGGTDLGEELYLVEGADHVEGGSAVGGTADSVTPPPFSYLTTPTMTSSLYAPELVVFFSLRVTNMNFSDDLFNKTSEEYIALEHTFTELLLPYLQRNLSGFRALEVLSFSRGSVVVSSKMRFSRSVPYNVTAAVQKVLENFCSSAARGRNMDIDRRSLDVETADRADPCRFMACPQDTLCDLDPRTREPHCRHRDQIQVPVWS